MTASHITNSMGLGGHKVLVNYLATAQLDDTYEENPIGRLEWAKYGFDLNRMKAENDDYSKATFFPDDVKILDPKSQYNYKTEISQTWPESRYEHI